MFLTREFLPSISCGPHAGWAWPSQRTWRWFCWTWCPGKAGNGYPDQKARPTRVDEQVLAGEMLVLTESHWLHLLHLLLSMTWCDIHRIALCETKASLKTFMSSSLSKAGKLRLLVRDLKKGYTESATSTFLNDMMLEYMLCATIFWRPFYTTKHHPSCSQHGLKMLRRHLRSIKTLESHIADMDKHYDACNDAWAKGEVENFSTEESPGSNVEKTNQRTKIMPAVFNPSWWHIPSFKLRWYKLAEQCMKDGTFAFITQLSTLGPVCFVNRLFFQNVLVWGMRRPRHSRPR